MKLLIFDIDGVLLNNLGYRGAFGDSLRHYLSRAGVKNWYPETNDLGLFFESTGVTSEWDMVPIVLAAAYEVLMQSHVPPDSVQTMQQFEDYYNKLENMRFVNLEPVLEKMVPVLGKEKLAATHLFTICKDGHSSSSEILPLLRSRKIFETLLKDTRDPFGCEITRQLQNRLIGSELFQEVYKQDAIFPCESTLKTMDKANISGEILARLDEKTSNNGYGACLMTARPTYPPKEISIDKAGYSPEGEIAVQLLKMEKYPLMGYGRLTYISKDKGIIPEKILKPSPFQALASIFAAASGEEYPSLLYAWDLLFGKGSPEKLPGQIEIHVFEDSPHGIRSCVAAGEILVKQGLKIDLHLWGIATHPQKTAALQESGALVLPDINTALGKVLD